MAERTAKFYPFELDTKPDSCWSFHTGPDGRVYAAACCEFVPGEVVHIVRYNGQTDSLDRGVDVAEAVSEPADSGRGAQ